jgi:endonuclease/exonuclease/phosphatase family metal-dependent hydrolase
MASSSFSLRIATYNLRYDSKPDNITVSESLAALSDPLAEPAYLNKTGEQPWSTRRLRVYEHMINEGVQLFGVQEALVRQVNDLAELFGSGWGWVGVGRDDGEQAGEYSAVFYDKTAIKLRSADYFWLSNTPFQPSKYPDAGSVRICTATKLTTSSGKNFTFLNTHLDNDSDMQRKVAASMLLIRARYEAAQHGEPVLITGDFNSPPTGVDSGAYQIITGASKPVAVNTTFAAKYAVGDDQLPGFEMLDLRAAAPRIRVNANFATFTGFNTPADTSDWTRIDFIFGGSNGGWDATSYKVGSSLTDDGILASDHRPVFADIIL